MDPVELHWSYPSPTLLPHTGTPSPYPLPTCPYSLVTTEQQQYTNVSQVLSCAELALTLGCTNMSYDLFYDAQHWRWWVQDWALIYCRPVLTWLVFSQGHAGLQPCKCEGYISVQIKQLHSVPTLSSVSSKSCSGDFPFSPGTNS